MGKTIFSSSTEAFYNHAVKLHTPISSCNTKKTNQWLGGDARGIGLRFLLFSNEDPSSLTPGSAIEMPQQPDWTSRSDQLADSVIPCSHPASIQRASLKRKVSRRCCKCHAVIVRRAGIPCTLSVCHAWGNPTLRSAGLTALIARISVLPLCTHR